MAALDSSPQIPKQRSCLLPVLVLAGIAVIAAVLLFRGGKDVEDGAGLDAIDREYTVTRGEFNINIPLSGTLDAVKHHLLSCDVERGGQLKIEKLVEEKSRVKEGDEVFVLSCDDYVNSLENYLTNLENERKNLVLAEQDLEIKRSTNLSSLKSALDALKTAEEALARYKDLDAPKKRKDLASSLLNAEEKLEQVTEDLSDANDALLEAEWKGSTASEEAEDAVKKSKQAVDDATKALETAQHESRVFKQYEHPQKLRSLNEDVFKKRLELRKVTTQCRANIVQAERTIQNHKILIRNAEKEITEIRENMAKLVIKAPVDGIISFGDPNRPHWRTPKEIKVGTVVSPREVLGSIPDLSSYIVKVDVPESFRSRVKLDIEASCHSPAVPDLVISGKVTEIAPTATNVVFWDKNSPKIYTTEIATPVHDERLSPGMSVEVEIRIETVKDVLYVPVEALYNTEGKTYARVVGMGGAKEREVEAGRASASYVEILSGLEEGDTVLLVRRAQAAEAETQ